MEYDTLTAPCAEAAQTLRRFRGSGGTVKAYHCWTAKERLEKGSSRPASATQSRVKTAPTPAGFVEDQTERGNS
jgi:hypothetical protein